MATTSISNAAELQKSKRFSVRRLIVATGATAAVVFILCWLGTFISFSSPTHAYIALFTAADTSTFRALAEGTIWSLVFGALVGAVFAQIYNATAALVRN